MQALQKVGVQVVGYKPIAFGQDEMIYPPHNLSENSDYDTKDNPDVLTLMASTEEKVSYEEVNSYTFLHTIPILTEDSKQVHIEKLNKDLAHLRDKYPDREELDYKTICVEKGLAMWAEDDYEEKGVPMEKRHVKKISKGRFF